MSNVPTNLIPSTITQLPEYTGTSTLGYFAYSLGGRSYKVQFGQLAAVGAVPSTRVIATGTGLTGGGDLSQDRVISIANGGVGTAQLANSGVVAGVYGSGSAIPVLTVDATGRVTTATTSPLTITGYVPDTRTVTAGAGLLGGGSLAANRTFSVDFYASAPQALGLASAGVSNAAARGDHVHPAVNLSDTTQTQGALPLGRGGTGDALSPVAGAVAYSTGSKFALTSVGAPGQVLTSGGTGDPYWTTVTGVGTVTSVNVSGGTTGLTTSGGPITGAGTITLGGTLAVANGGTGATSAATARTSLGAAASGANTDITSIALTTGTINTAPTAGTDIANKAYVDTISAGINFHQAVRLASAAALPANTYNNGSGGVGATLTANANGALSIDGVAVAVGNRVLIKNEVAQANNGVYTVTQTGSGAAPYILTRATDYNSAGTGVNQIDAGDFFLVTAGSTQANTSWVQQTPLPITVGTTALVFAQFGAPITYSAGTGLSLAGTVFSITNTGVTATSYGSASSVPVIAVNAQGQITSASSSSIAIAASQITSGSLAIANGGTGAGNAAAAFNNLSPITTAGDLIIGNGANSATRLGIGANGYILTSNGTTAVWNPAPSSMVYPGAGIPLSAGSSWGTSFNNSGNPITVAYGGTGVATLSSGYLVKGNGTSAVSASVIYDNGTNVGVGVVPQTWLSSAKVIQVGPCASLWSLSTSLSRFSTNSYTDTAGTARYINTAAAADYRHSNGAHEWLTAASGTAGNAITFTQAMTLDNSGNLGIGTTSPGSPLDVVTTVSGANGITVRGRSSDNVSNISLKSNDAATTYAQIQGRSTELRLQTNSTLPVTIYANSTEYFRIGPAGQIGLTGANYGTSGQILTSNGSGSAPTWQNAPATGVTQARATAISMILGF